MIRLCAAWSGRRAPIILAGETRKWRVPSIESIEPSSMTPAALAALPDALLLEAIQRQCFRYFWEGADTLSGLAADRRQISKPDVEFPVTIGGSGFGMMALIVAV